MALLDIVQRFCRRSGLKVPSVAIESVDKQIIQMVGLLNEVVEDLTITRKLWTAQQIEHTFTSVASVTQIPDLRVACPGIVHIVRDTMFDRTSNLPIKGPLSEQEWQNAQATSYSSAYSNFRIIQNRLDMYPQLSAGHSLAFEYKSHALVYDPISSQFKKYFSLDTDTFALDEMLLISGLRWIWKKEKGLPYAEEFKTYERNVVTFGSTESVPKKITLHGSTIGHGLLVPDSNWSVH